MTRTTARNVLKLLVLLAVLGGGVRCGSGEPRGQPTAHSVALAAPPTLADGTARTAVIEGLGHRGTRLAVFDLDDGSRRITARSTAVSGGDVGLAAPAFSPDGERVAVVDRSISADGRGLTVLLVAAVRGGGFARRVPGLRLIDVDIFRPAWTPDGRSLAVPAEGGVDLVDVRSGQRRTLLNQRASEVAFAPNGKAYTFDGPGGVWLASTAGGRPRRIAEHAEGATWSPDSRRIAYLSTRDHNGSVSVSEGPPQTAHEIYVADGDGSAERRLTHTTADESGPLRWTLDGRAVIHSRFAEGRLTVRVLGITEPCASPLRVPTAASPPDRDLSDWDVRANVAAVTRGC